MNLLFELDLICQNGEMPVSTALPPPPSSMDLERSNFSSQQYQSVTIATIILISRFRNKNNQQATLQTF